MSFKHFWSQIILLFLLCIVYAILLEVMPRKSTCLHNSADWSCVKYTNSIGNRKILREAVESINQRHMTVERAIQQIESQMLDEKGEFPKLRQFNEERLMLNYLIIYILEQDLSKKGIEVIERKLCPVDWRLALLFIVILWIPFWYYVWWRRKQLDPGSEIREKAHSINLNTHLFAFLLLTIIALLNLFEVQNVDKYLISGTSFFGPVAVFWKQIKKYTLLLEKL